VERVPENDADQRVLLMANMNHFNRRKFLRTSAAAPSGPNIVLILADDMGFSDVSPYGGEIRTPNLQRLADEGLRFTQFYNNAKCTPTRAWLLSGQLDPARYSHDRRTDARGWLAKARRCVAPQQATAIS
jgi:hypothetical protein